MTSNSVSPSFRIASSRLRPGLQLPDGAAEGPGVPEDENPEDPRGLLLAELPIPHAVGVDLDRNRVVDAAEAGLQALADLEVLDVAGEVRPGLHRQSKGDLEDHEQRHDNEDARDNHLGEESK
jgi:hypothetical protein